MAVRLIVKERGLEKKSLNISMIDYTKARRVIHLPIASHSIKI